MSRRARTGTAIACSSTPRAGSWWRSADRAQNETAAGRRRFAYRKAEPIMTSIVIPPRRPVHRDTAVQAVGEDVVGRQGHEDVVGMGIDGQRVRGPSRDRWVGGRLGGGVRRRNNL